MQPVADVLLDPNGVTCLEEIQEEIQLTVGTVKNHGLKGFNTVRTSEN